jgi:NodT family efflux transporter outer membrane factor (OMF) lipoprotein
MTDLRTIDRSRLVMSSILCCLLAGCVVGPDFHSPSQINGLLPAIIDRGASSPIKDIARVTSDATVQVAWWRGFKDPVLDRLQARIADRNLDVRTATLRIAESRAQVVSTEAAALPKVDGTASYTRSALSQNGLLKLVPLSSLGGGSSSSSALTNGYDNFSVGFDASWELDLWGHVARQVEAADAQYAADQETRRDTLVSTLAELARDYVNLRGTQRQIVIARDNLKAQGEILAVTRQRQAKGLVTGLDTESAAAQVESLRALIPQLQQQEVQGVNAISLLLDEPPLALSDELAASTSPLREPRVLPIGLPSELARRRPDIRRAEAQLHAATANIGVAVAEFYPSVKLNASPTLQAMAPKDIFKGSSLQYMNVGPSVTLPIFEGGRLKSNLVLQEKRQQEAAIGYHKAVLSAWHDIVNALTAYGTERQRRERLRGQVGHAREALAFARSRYDQGVADFTTLLDDTRTVLSAEQQLAQSTTNVSVDLVGLYKALGGGWEETYPPSGGGG